jgi:hypothetical protein
MCRGIYFRTITYIFLATKLSGFLSFFESFIRQASEPSLTREDKVPHSKLQKESRVSERGKREKSESQGKIETEIWICMLTLPALI